MQKNQWEGTAWGVWAGRTDSKFFVANMGDSEPPAEAPAEFAKQYPCATMHVDRDVYVRVLNELADVQRDRYASWPETERVLSGLRSALHSCLSYEHV